MEKQVVYTEQKHDWNKITFLSDEQRKQVIQEKIEKLRLQSLEDDKHRFMLMFEQV